MLKSLSGAVREVREKGPARVQIEAEPSRAALKFGVNAARHSNGHLPATFPEAALPLTGGFRPRFISLSPSNKRSLIVRCANVRD